MFYEVARRYLLEIHTLYKFITGANGISIYTSCCHGSVGGAKEGGILDENLVTSAS